MRGAGGRSVDADGAAKACRHGLHALGIVGRRGKHACIFTARADVRAAHAQTALMFLSCATLVQRAASADSRLRMASAGWYAAMAPA